MRLVGCEPRRLAVRMLVLCGREHIEAGTLAEGPG